MGFFTLSTDLRARITRFDREVQRKYARSPLISTVVPDWIRKYKLMTHPAQQVAIVLSTFGVGQAAAVARVLVEERLAACVNVLPPMTSVYRWDGAVQQDAEEQVVIKTSTDRLAA